MFKVNSKNTRTTSLTIKLPERPQQRLSNETKKRLSNETKKCIAT